MTQAFLPVLQFLTTTTNQMDISHLINTSVDDCRSAVLHATREQLIAAHRYCEASYPLNKTRKAVIAAALRRQQKATTAKP